MNWPRIIVFAVAAWFPVFGAPEPATFRVVSLCNSRPCTRAQIVQRLQLVKSYEERFSPDPQGHLKILVQFSKPVDKDTVVVGSTVIIDAPLDHAAAVKILWPSGDVDNLTLISEKTRAELFPPGKRTIDFVFTLRGTDAAGSGVIKSTDGEPLDGDGNGKPGGDYVIRYRCAEMDPFWCS